MYQNHLHVAGRRSNMGSQSGSRNPSRGGSPHPSRKGSRHPSRNNSNDCSPSISRRGSHQSPTKHKGNVALITRESEKESFQNIKK